MMYNKDIIKEREIDCMDIKDKIKIIKEESKKYYYNCFKSKDNNYNDYLDYLSNDDDDDIKDILYGYNIDCLDDEEFKVLKECYINGFK